MSHLKNLRIADPVLTELAQGYHNNELVGETLMPIVEVGKEEGVVPVFGREAFKVRETVRQIRAKSNRMEPDGITSLPIMLEEHDLEYPIDYREDYEAAFPLKKYALSVVQDSIALKRESQVASLVLNADNYDEGNKVVLSGTSQFTDKTSDPFGVFDDAIAAVKRSIGRAPNVCVIPANVWKVLKTHPALIEKIKYVQRGILTPELFAELVSLKHVKIGAAVSSPDGTALEDIWKNDIVLAYSALKATGEKGTIYEPSFGYNVRRKGSLIVDTYTENGGKIELVRCTDIIKPHLLGKAAGYLIKDCVGA